MTTPPLLSAPALAAEIAADPALVVLDVRYWLREPARGAIAYAEGHLPGARFVDLDADLASEPGPGGAGGRHPMPTPGEFQAALRRIGVCNGDRVVVYDQATSLAAGRAWWMLADAGVDVHVLDGGYEAWQAAGLPVSGGSPDVAPGDVVLYPGMLPRISADEIPALLAAGHRLIDVRAPERFRGDNEPIDTVAGHIPGATNLPVTRLQDADGRYLPAEKLRQLLAEVRSGDAVSCGSGITACQALVAFAAAGIEGVALYPGSWSDWISDPRRPVAIGD